MTPKIVRESVEFFRLHLQGVNLGVAIAIGHEGDDSILGNGPAFRLKQF